MPLTKDEPKPKAAEPEAPPERDEAAERADYVARSVVADVAPASARDQARYARTRANAEDPEQAAVDNRLAELLDQRADEWDKQQALTAKARGRTRGRPTVHGPGGAPLGSDIPNKVRRGDLVAYHTSSDVPDQPALVLRLHPEADDNKRYLADLHVFPVVEGSDSATVTNVTYGPGLGQFGELPDDPDDIGRGPEGNVIKRPWQHE
jgi:hypothetical protein